jgi:radical SAM superfamily enzyme YgiQ (UPF0313 family)
VTNDAIRGVAAMLRASGILLGTFNMMAMPGETFEQALSTIRFNQEIGAEVPRITFTFPLRGTRLTGYAMDHGYLTDAELASLEREVAAGTFRLRPCFGSPDRERFVRLFQVFQLAIVAGLGEDAIRRLVAVPLPGLVSPLRPLMLYLERRFFRARLIPGFRMFLHAGHPLGRTKNFNNFIP